MPSFVFKVTLCSTLLQLNVSLKKNTMKNLKLLLIAACVLTYSVAIAQWEYYASNRAVNSINKYDETGAFVVEIIAENAGGLSSPQDIVFFPNEGFMIVASSNTNEILKFDITTGDFLGVWNLDSVTQPTKMTIGPDNLLYVTQWGQTPITSRILKFNLDGTLNSPLNVVIPTPLGMGHVWDTDGNFYVAFFGIGAGNGSIHKFDPNGNSLGTFIDNTFLNNPTYIWWDTNGDMMVQDFNAGKVLRYDSDGNYIEDYITGLANPEGFAHLPNGNLIVVERTINQISEFDLDGNYLGQWDSGVILNDPNLLVMRDPNLGNQDFTDDTVFLIPSIGASFTLNAIQSQNFEILNIYNYAGELITQIDPQITSEWQASNLADGMYFVSGTDETKRRYVQKIIIRK